MDDQTSSAAAFNMWMDDFVNDPESFQSTTASALEHLREKLDGRAPTYGESSAATYAAYLAKVEAKVVL
jgi:hypothetical protein